MDEVTFHREPPSHIPTLVTAFTGWIDAGEAATDAMRFLVRQLAAEPLAAIDLEDFVDFTQVRPVVRLTAEGERTIRWPRSAFWLWQPPAPRAGLLLFRGLEPQRRWRAYATALLDMATRCGVQRIVSLGAMLADLPHTRPPRVTGSSTDPHWHAQLEAWGMARRSRYEGPTGIASVMLEAARRRGIASLTFMGQAPHYLQGTTNPAMRQALLTAVARLLDLELDVSPLDAAVQAFRTRCDQAVAQDAATQAYVRQLEQAYDATGDETPPPRRDDDFNPEQLMHELEAFLRVALHIERAKLHPLHPIALTSSGSASGIKEQHKDTNPAPRVPTLSHIVPEDLQETARLLTLFEQAQAHGLIGKSDSERLTFLGLAEHARVAGSANPCGLFAALVRRQCWHFVTDSDEDAAHQRFKAYLYGTDHQTRGSPQPHDLMQPELSKDAAIVRYLQTHLARAGFNSDVFGLVSRDDASWARERWDNAVGELDQARRVWHQGNMLNRLSDLTDLGEPLGCVVSPNNA